jgi:hypothetical protein
MRKLLLAAAGGALVWIAPGFATSPDTPLDTAGLAWDRGDYVSALTTYLQVLDSPAGDDAFETIALQTGELFRTTELTPDGAEPSFSADGRYIAYETGEALARRTRIVLAAQPLKPIAELSGRRGVFSPDSTRFAYLKAPSTPEFERALKGLDDEPAQQRAQRLAAVNAMLATDSQVAVRELASGRESALEAGSMRKTGLAYGARGVILAGSIEGQGGQLFVLAEGSAPVALTSGPGDKTIGAVSRGGTALTFSGRGAGAGGRGGAGRGAGPGAPGAGPQFHVLKLDGTAPVAVNGSAPAFSADGETLAYIARSGAEYRLAVAPVADPAKETVVRAGMDRIDAPVLSPDGNTLAFQMMTKEDWEIYTVDLSGRYTERLTREIQHDLLPRFLGPDTVLGMIGEARHRRSYLYDLRTGKRTRVFHNNTVRTIAPEYAWVPNPDGSQLLVVAERDGDTVSVERGVYLVDLKQKISKDDLRTRLRANLASEQALRSKAERIFKPIAADVRKVVADASVARVYGYEKALFDFDSKHISQPGNRKAIQYLFDTYKSFGYEPELQEFEAQQRGGGTGTALKTANVLATLKGSTNPELVYVVSSHFDSVAIGPGADDDTSGTAALLEAARILARHPQPATIVFASFTGEEAGLLGSREYVRQAVAGKVRIVGALNNDMIGWANDHRLDNTIRYSNPGIRDVQHGAAMQFTNLITYDALYYKSTDAAAYYEAFGDIVGGIGSYPVLGNPHYHQSHDLLDTINHQLVTEVAKTTAATLMMLASSPSRLSDLKIESVSGGLAKVTWTPSPERGVTDYLVSYGPSSNPEARQMRVKTPAANVPNAVPGTVIQVKAINSRGLEGWDWARTSVKPANQ